MFLSVENISKSFGNEEEGTLRRVLSGISFGMEKGESIAILGASGSGKTTLLNIIGTLMHPDSGSISFEGRDLVNMKEKDLDHFRNRHVGFVFQLHHLLPQCTLHENVLIPTLPLKAKQEKKQKVLLAEKMLKRVGLWDHRNKIPSKLSGGECQRVAVVRSLINQPELLLADEPTGALDSENAEIISDLLTELNRDDGLSLLVVTHSQKLASKIKRIYLIEDGKLNPGDKLQLKNEKVI